LSPHTLCSKSPEASTHSISSTPNIWASQSSTLPTIDVRGPHPLCSDLSLLCLPFPGFMNQAQFEILFRNTACGAAKSHPAAGGEKASLHQTPLSAHCCQPTTLPHAIANQY